MAFIPNDLGGNAFTCTQNYLDPIHGVLDVQILERYTEYKKARNEVTHISVIELNV